MISRELIEKINSLWHKQNTVGLTPTEKEEQKLAREEYLAAIRSQVRGMLEAIRNPDEKTTQDSSQTSGHSGGCSCKGCRH